MGINVEQWLHDNVGDLQGKVVVITGAAGGLGSVTTRYLLRANAKVVMLGRDIGKIEILRRKLKEEFPNAEVDGLQIDLNHIDSIDAVVAKLINQRIDYLVLNAGVYNVPVIENELGYNNIFQTNFIGHYYLVKKLLPALQRTNGKVVAVSSIAMTYGKLDENDIDYKKRTKPSKIYGNSKRFLTLALSEMFKERDDVRLAIVHPGVTLTPMTNSKNNGFIKLMTKLLFPKPEVAVLSFLKGIVTDIEFDEWIGPKKFKVWGLPCVSKLPAATAEERAKIFNVAENIYKAIETAKNIE